jgi:SAM-dependent methyltransferase
MISLRNLKRRLKTTILHPRYLSNRAIRHSLKCLAPQAYGRMLDIGCGYKPYRSLFAPYVSEHIGVDIPVTIHGTDYLDIGGTALALPVAAASYDTVLATEVMEHVPDPHRMLAEIHRVLRPSGRLILSVPLHEPLHELPYDYYRYTHMALQYLIEESGFAIKQIERRGGPLMVVCHLFCSFLYRRYGLVDFPDDLRIRPISGWLVITLIILLQLLVRWIDPIVRDDHDTLGYVVFAVKR